MMRFAYVDVLTKEVMEKIISRSEEVLDGRHLLIKNGKSFEGRPAERKQRYQVKQYQARRTDDVSPSNGGDVDGPVASVTEKDQNRDGLASEGAVATLEKTERKETKKKRSKRA